MLFTIISTQHLKFNESTLQINVMAQKQVSGLTALSCYTVDSDSDSDQEDDHETRVQDFGELSVKQENVEDDESPAWVIDDQGYQDPTEQAKIAAEKSDFLQPQDIKVEIVSDEESSSDSGSDSSDDEDVIKKTAAKNSVADDEDRPEKTGPVKTANELLHKDLPPVDEVHVNVAASECNIVGHIKNLVDDLVVVESLIGQPALDLDTVLFVKEGDIALGRVFDVIGPVTQPLYVVRFNSKEHVEEKGVTVGMKVYYAPKSELTSYVFLEQLMAMKISDASWINDEEPPPQFLDYSDDEEEQRAKKEYKMKKQQQQQLTASVSDGATDAKRPRQTNKSQQKNLRQCNNRYTAESNPFYRTSRSYNPQQSGIQWSQYNVPMQYNPYSQPPPPITPSYYTPPPAAAPTAVTGAAWQAHYNPYQQIATNISNAASLNNSHVGLWQQHNAQTNNVIHNLDLPPPPPPGED